MKTQIIVFCKKPFQTLDGIEKSYILKKILFFITMTAAICWDETWEEIGIYDIVKCEFLETILE